ncbi:MAG: hypothetical protein Q9N67_06810 [Ghiorsea sp.]|nr:hypothetical protein [Ghiorsea sp.]
MIKSALFSLMFVAVLSVSLTSQSIIPSLSAEGANMAQIQLILKKMKSNMQNMKDFDELEDAGMDKKDVDRLRNATKAKVQQMTSNAITLIRQL